MYGTLWNCQKDVRELGVNGSLRLNVTLMSIPKCYKARHVAKSFTQKDDIDYKETFSLVSKNDFFRIIMTLIAHYDLELHQMDVKLPF